MARVGVVWERVSSAARGRGILATAPALPVLLALVAIGCGGGSEPAALQVGPVGYAESELGALTGGQRDELARITAFGLAVAEQRLDTLLAPLIEGERRSRLLAKLAAEVAAREAGIDEAQLRAAYSRDPASELTVRHLVVLSERWQTDAARSEARSRARAALERIRAGEPFETVAGEVSEEPGAAERGGLLQPGREGTWVDEFWQAADALDPGEVSDVVETEYGFHVLRLEDRDTVAFDAVRDRVVARVVAERGAGPAAQAWAQREAALLTLEAAGIEALAADRATGDVVLARWPEGAYTVGDFRAYLLAADPELRQRLEGADAGAYQRVVAAAARNALLAQRARAMGLELDAEARSAIEREVTEAAERRGAALGFRPGMTAAQVKEMALEALGANQQSASIARSELSALEPALFALYPVSRPAAESAAAGES